MFSKSVIVIGLVTFLCHEIKASEHNKNDEPLYKLLEKMVKMMDEYKMNVTVIGSYMERRMDGQLVKMQDGAVTMPLNTVHLKESGLTGEKQKMWMKEVEEMKLENVMTAAARDTHVPTMETKIQATDINKVPQTPSWEWIVNYKKCCQQFKTQSPITEFMYNIKLETPEETMVKMLVGNVTVTLKDHSSSMTETELAVIQTELPRTWFMFEDETDWARAMVQIFDEKMPGMNWQVILGAEHWQIDTTKWAWFIVEGSDVLVYSYKM